MIKPLVITMLLFVTAITNANASNAQGCPMPSDEKLVCEVVLCNPLGIAISESRSECLEVNRRFAIYLATLGFWDKPPSYQGQRAVHFTEQPLAGTNNNVWFPIGNEDLLRAVENIMVINDLTKKVILVQQIKQRNNGYDYEVIYNVDSEVLEND